MQSSTLAAPAGAIYRRPAGCWWWCSCSGSCTLCDLLLRLTPAGGGDVHGVNGDPGGFDILRPLRIPPAVHNVAAWAPAAFSSRLAATRHHVSLLAALLLRCQYGGGCLADRGRVLTRCKCAAVIAAAA